MTEREHPAQQVAPHEREALPGSAGLDSLSQYPFTGLLDLNPDPDLALDLHLGQELDLFPLGASPQPPDYANSGTNNYSLSDMHFESSLDLANHQGLDFYHDDKSSTAIYPSGACNFFPSSSPRLLDTTNLGFPSSLTSSSRTDGGTELFLPLSAGSISSRNGGSNSLSASEPGAIEAEVRVREGLMQPEGVRLLLRCVASHTFDGDLALDPGPDSHSSAHPLLVTLTKLEHAAERQQESRAGQGLFSLPPPDATWDLVPPRRQCDALLDAYIKNFESVLRILHVSSFLQEYDRLWSRPPSQPNCADRTFLCRLLLVLVLGSHVSLSPGDLTEGDRALKEQATRWLACARDLLKRQLAETGRGHFETAQIMCLLALVRHTQKQRSLSGPDCVFGDYDQTRIGIQMRLYKEPDAAAWSPKDMEMRRRLWCTMLELSLQLCLDEELPPPIASDGYDCVPPSNILDDDIDKGIVQAGLTPSTILGLLAKTQRLRLRILHLITLPKTPKTSEDLRQVAAELNETCHATSDTMRGFVQPAPTEFQTKMLHMFTWPFLVAAHSLSGVDQGPCEPVSYHSRRMRMEVSTMLLDLHFPGINQPVSLTTSLDNAGPGTSSASASHARGVIANDNPPNSDVLVSSGVHLQPSSALGGAESSYTALLLHGSGQGHLVRAQRRATALLCLDLINELEANEFPTLNRPSQKQLRRLLQGAIHLFESRMRCAGAAHSVREFVVFAAAASYIDTLLANSGNKSSGGHKGSFGSLHDVTSQKLVTKAVSESLTICAEVLRQAKL